MSLSKLSSSNIRKRKVLFEKYQNRKWMIDLIKKQKFKMIISQKYKEAGKWRELEKLFYDAEQYPDNIETFDNIFFEIYEKKNVR